MEFYSKLDLKGISNMKSSVLLFVRLRVPIWAKSHLCTCMWGSDRLRAGRQEVGKCSTRGESWGMYITFASAKIANKAEPTLALKPRGDVTRNPKQGYQWPQKRTCVRQKLFKKNKKKHEIHEIEHREIKIIKIYINVFFILLLITRIPCRV